MANKRTITFEIAEQIRRESAMPEETFQSIGKRYGISVSAVHSIARGETYKTPDPIRVSLPAWRKLRDLARKYDVTMDELATDIILHHADCSD